MINLYLSDDRVCPRNSIEKFLYSQGRRWTSDDLFCSIDAPGDCSPSTCNLT